MKTTFPQLLLDHAAARPQAPALREKELGIWQTIAWGELAELVRSLACGLAAAGLKRGEHLAVIGENRPRLYASMLAAQSLGAVPVPLYQDAAAKEFVFPIANAEIAFAVVEDQEQVDKLLEVRGECPLLAAIWFDDPRGLRHYGEPGLASLDALVAGGAAFAQVNPGFFAAEVAKNRPDDAAAMFFTSGTTGNPKGVVHSHDTLIDRARAGARFDKLTEKEEVLAYLPPAWVGQNIFSYAQWLACGYVVNCPESASTVTLDLKEIGPTYYFAPPRVFEGLLTSVTIRMEDAARATRWLYERGVRVMGIDAWGWDRPLHLQAADALASGERGVFWAAHQADLAYSQIERLCNLGALPPTGFTVSCFPLPITGASAGLARVVAIL